MPEELSERQPFPGPGLSVRVVGEITPEKLDEEKKATVVAEELLTPLKPSQFFAAIFSSDPAHKHDILASEAAEYLKLSAVEVDILHEKATGVIGGKRTYGDVVLLGLGGAQPPHKKLQEARKRLQNGHPEVARVLVKVGMRHGMGYRVALRAIKTRDFLTAEVADVPWRTLEETAERILEKCPKVSGVYYDVTPKPPATVEFE
ncbi:hypothetical protein A3K78_10230 [Candidatus Bathyarchaeota archaeon RBG_13_52_12]|nr:MAG: hypothetical protein A3K78_10230 [Candidatus Bathyarchaeota archaeon RBG_13_52_12]